MAEKQGQQQTIDLSKLSLEQLNNFKEQTEDDLKLLNNSLQQLRVAGSRYLTSKQCLEVMTPENKGKEVLVPMTSSMYVPGKLAVVDSIIVDIGTGYYIKKSIKEATEFADRKIQIINEKMDQVSYAISVKKRNYESILLVMQTKIAEYERAEQEKEKQQQLTDKIAN